MDYTEKTRVTRPVTDLFKQGVSPLPARTCRTRMNRPGVWSWKRLYATEEDAEVAAVKSGMLAYDCPNCGFWHTGHHRKLR